MMKIYTKTGDKGMTSLSDGTRLSKADTLINAYGTVDELNSQIGVLMAVASDDFLTEVQRTLFSVGGMLATPCEKWENFRKKSDISAFTRRVEEKIDELSEQLPPFKGFILPQGNTAIAQAHVCRTVCRRAERAAVPLLDRNPAYEPALKLLNRLSDYFFVLARFYHKKMNVDETIW